MKLLFDQNISFRILKKISSHFPEAQQVRILSLENAKDFEIWQYAKKSGYAIVTFDADFSEYASVYGHPPKIIWLRTGNTTTNAIAALLLEKAEVINDFLNAGNYKEIACLEID